MPTSKDLKRLARSRMKKTGESYTTARAQLIAKKTLGSTRRIPLTDYAKTAGMSDAAVRKATGRDWKSWVRALDAAGARERTHREIAKHVHDHYDLSGWWSQTVTVGYERIRGLREKGQRRGGGFEVSKSKTIAVPIETLYAAFATARIRRRWLGGIEPKVKKATVNRSIRILWPDGSSLEAHFWPKGPAKSQVQIQHRELVSRAAAEKVRESWSERLADLKDLLTVGEV